MQHNAMHVDPRRRTVYSLFPSFTPAHMRTSLMRQGLAHQYKFTRPVCARVLGLS
jgi:hypothetical protein